MMYDDFYGNIDSFAGATENIDQYSASAGDGIFVVLMVVYMLVIGAFLIGGIIDYLLRGFGMYKLGKAEGKNNCWMAFVPFARTYFQGELGGPITLKKKTMKNPGIWLIIVPIVGGVIAAVGYFIFFMVIMVNAILASEHQPIENVAIGTVSGIIVFLVIASLVAVAYQALIHVLYVLVNHQIYERYTSKTMAIVHAILGTLIPLYQSICMFVFGRRAEQMCEEQQEIEQLENKNE